MLSKKAQIIMALAATSLLTIFVTGLAYSISAGAAGFWGGLPYWVIVIAVLAMAVYDFWDETIRKGE